MPDFKAEGAPVVPASLRTSLYWATAVSAAGGLAVTGLADIWMPDLAEPIRQTVAVLSMSIGTLGGIVGVVYRPTR